MSRTRIKICGITRAQDVAPAVAAGADAVGINFYSQAQRSIDLATARQIISALPPMVTPVGLFVNAEFDEIHFIAEALHLTHIQLHGQETPELVERLNAYTILKSILGDRATLAEEVLRWKELRLGRLRHLKGFVLETPRTGLAGGSGVENDWAMIAEFARAGLFDGGPPLIAAGGLNPENVGMVIRALRPWAVDVSSGVEESFGKKSPEKMRAFAAAVRSADLETF